MIRITAAFVLGAVLVVDPPAYADPVTITGGRLAFDDGDPPSFRVEIASSPFLLGGVWLDPNPGSNSVLSLAPDSAIGCLFIAACVGGDVVSLGATISGTGAGTVGPQADPENPSIRPIVATFHFTTPGALVVDQPGDLFLMLERPFQFRGDFRAFADSSLTQVLFETTLIGRGKAGATLSRGEGSGPFTWEESTYTFAPVPEPATWTLLGTGLAAGWAAGRRARRTGS
jgi:hypothetical protein